VVRTLPGSSGDLKTRGSVERARKTWKLLSASARRGEKLRGARNQDETFHLEGGARIVALTHW